MAIFGNQRFGSTNNEFENHDFGINIANESCLSEIFLDTTRELVAIEAATYVADVMLEEAALEGTNVQPMLEGVMSNFWEKLKAAVKKLIAKIKEWFKKIKKMFQILFSSGKEFIKKYKTDILRAEAVMKGYEYSIKNYNYTAINQGPNSGIKDDSKDGYIENDKDLEAYKKVVLGSKTKAEYVDDTRLDLYVGKDDEAEDFEDFKGGPQVQQMISIVEGGEKLVKEYDKFESKENKKLNDLIKEINEAERGDADKDTKKYSNAVAKASFDVELNIAVVNVHAKVLKSCVKDSQRVLKGLLLRKPKKEGTSFASVDSDNILESAMNMFM